MRTALLVGSVLLLCSGCGAGGGAPQPGGPLAPGPEITAAVPTSGSAAGGTLLTIEGTGLAGTTSVLVGGVPAVDLVILDDSTITCRTPAGSAGTADVTISSAGGSDTAASAFTYVTFTPNFLGRMCDLTPAPAGTLRRELSLHGYGERVYALWLDNRTGTANDVFLNRSDDGGRTFFGTPRQVNETLPGVLSRHELESTSDGDRVYAVWTDDRNRDPAGPLGPRDVFFNRSLDGGTTWLGQDVRLNTGAAAQSTPGHLSVHAEGDSVHVMWFTSEGGKVDLYYNRSTDAGLTWLPQHVRVSDTGPTVNTVGDERLISRGNMVYAVWTEEISRFDVYFNRSIDGGQTWETPRRIEPLAQVDDAFGLQLGCSEQNVYVVWNATVSGDIRFIRSLDQGASWPASDVRLDTDVGGTGASRSPRLVVDGDTLFVAFEDDRSGTSDLLFQRSSDAGTTWLAAETRASTNDVLINSGQLAALHVAWVHKPGGTGDGEVHVTHSTDGGLTWSTFSTRLDVHPGGDADSRTPLSMWCDDLRVYVGWEEGLFDYGFALNASGP